MPEFSLETPVTAIDSVSKVIAARLRRLEITTIGDLLFYFPARYENYGQPVAIKDLEPGMMATVSGTIALVANRRSPRQRKLLTEALLTDATGSIQLIWFNQPWIGKQLKIGQQLFVSGKVQGDMFATQFVSPTYELAKRGAPRALVPIYSLTEGLTNKRLQELILSVLDEVKTIPDFLPPYICEQAGLLSLDEALRTIHDPSDDKVLAAARFRLSFQELLLIQLWALNVRNELGGHLAPKIPFAQTAIQEFVKELPFALTTDQKRSAWEIFQDLAEPRPMNRLLEGDVGSGKTLVAALAMYNVKLAGYQSVLMAPTEILAAQHLRTLRRDLESCGVTVGLLTRTQQVIGDEVATKKEFLARCTEGEIDIIIGTHSLIQKDVSFKNLALVIIDEQHRFGVRQRQALRQQSSLVPHLLSLTATPIPRSLALTLYGDLDLSLLRHLPPGRKPIVTRLVPPEKRTAAYQYILKKISEGRQVFVICPLIDPSDTLGVRSVTQEYERLNKEIFPDIPVGLLHGRLKSEDKAAVLEKFGAQEIKILVSTSVIEVGIDFPNATIMMVEGAERFGLSQLHQFRGRVGRGEHQSYCFIMSDRTEPDILNRLRVLEESADGFTLAERDLELRGSGSVFGFEQSGFTDLKMADLSDLELIKHTREVAAGFLKTHQLVEFPLLKQRLESLGLSRHLE